MTIKLRRDTAANWASANPTLAEGQPGYDQTNNQLRIGDGSTAWTSLTALGGGGGVTDGDKGDITVSGSGATWTIDNGVVTLAKMANMATASVIYRKTSGTGAPEVQTLATLKTDLGLTGTNSGDQTITLTGDVTGSGTGSFAATIASGAVTLAKMANMATASLIYRKTAGSGAPEVNTLATLKTDLGLTGTNSGDQTSIVGITGTKSQFDTAVSDGNIQWVGDAPTAHTHPASEISDSTSAGRAVLTAADASAQRTALGLVIGTNVQAYDAELAAIAGLTSAADRVPYFTGSGTAALATFTSAGRALVDDADAAAQRTTLGLGNSATLNTGTSAGTVAAGDHTHSDATTSVAGFFSASDKTKLDGIAASATVGATWGTNLNSIPTPISAIAAVTPANNRLVYFNGASSADITPFTGFARTLMDDADAAAAQATLGLVIGTNVQAYDADLSALATLTGTNTIYYRSAADTWSPVTIGTNLTFSGGTLSASGGGVSDGDKGDVVVSSSGSVWSLDYTAVNATIAPVFSNITSKPTSLSGYGIVGGNWKLPYTNGSGAYTELSLPASGRVLVGGGTAAAPIFDEVPAIWIRLSSAYTLANSTSAQKLFNSSTNGAVTLETGVYEFTAMIHITTMSATSGNGALSLAGTATLANILFQVWGIDNSSPFAAGNRSGSAANTTATPASALIAGTGTALVAQWQGQFDVTASGTVIPSIALVTGTGTDSVRPGSFFMLRRIGDTGTTTRGSWS